MVTESIKKLPISFANFATGGSIGTAAVTVDIADEIIITQTTAAQTLTLSSPTVVNEGREIWITNSPSSTTTFTISGVALAIGAVQQFIWNGSAYVFPNDSETTFVYSVASVAVTVGSNVFTHSLALTTSTVPVWQLFDVVTGEPVLLNFVSSTANTLTLNSPIALTNNVKGVIMGA